MSEWKNRKEGGRDGWTDSKGRKNKWKDLMDEWREGGWEGRREEGVERGMEGGREGGREEEE